MQDLCTVLSACLLRQRRGRVPAGARQRQGEWKAGGGHGNASAARCHRAVSGDCRHPARLPPPHQGATATARIPCLAHSHVKFLASWLSAACRGAMAGRERGTGWQGLTGQEAHAVPRPRPQQHPQPHLGQRVDTAGAHGGGAARHRAIENHDAIAAGSQQRVRQLRQRKRRLEVHAHEALEVVLHGVVSGAAATRWRESEASAGSAGQGLSGTASSRAPSYKAPA